MLYEYPLDVRMIYMNGRKHPKDPDPTFNGDSAAHWEGDTLVVDVIAIDERLRNHVPGPSAARVVSQRSGARDRALHPPLEELPHLSSHHRGPRGAGEALDFGASHVVAGARSHDEWGEVFCTHNEEPEEIKKIDAAAKKAK